MNKKVKRLRKVLIIVLIVIIGMLIKNLLDRDENRALRKYQLNNYIPSGMAGSYRSEHFSIYRMWTYHLNNNEVKDILSDIKNNSCWEKLSESDYQKTDRRLTYFDDEISNKTIDFQNAYIAIFDLHVGASYTNIQTILKKEDNKKNYIIFIYDATNKRYYSTIDLSWN